MFQVRFDYFNSNILADKLPPVARKLARMGILFLCRYFRISCLFCARMFSSHALTTRAPTRAVTTIRYLFIFFLLSVHFPLSWFAVVDWSVFLIHSYMVPQYRVHVKRKVCFYVRYLRQMYSCFFMQVPPVVPRMARKMLPLSPPPEL